MDYNDPGITTRQINGTIRHDPLSHAILKICDAAEAKYQPLIITPTIPSLPQSVLSFGVASFHDLPDVAALLST